MHASRMGDAHRFRKPSPFPGTSVSRIHVAGRMGPSHLRTQVFRLRVCDRERHIRADSSRKQLVVCSEEADPFTASLCESFVPGVVDAFVWFALPEGNPVVVFTEHL